MTTPTAPGGVRLTHAVPANCLVFRLSVSATGRSEDQRWAAEETGWRDLLAARGLERPAPPLAGGSRLLPSPVPADLCEGGFQKRSRLLDRGPAAAKPVLDHSPRPRRP